MYTFILCVVISCYWKINLIWFDLGKNEQVKLHWCITGKQSQEHNRGLEVGQHRPVCHTGTLSPTQTILKRLAGNTRLPNDLGLSCVECGTSNPTHSLENIPLLLLWEIPNRYAAGRCGSKNAWCLKTSAIAPSRGAWFLTQKPFVDRTPPGPAGEPTGLPDSWI